MTNNLIDNFGWSGEISNQQAKEKAAAQIAAKVNDGDIIGFGSGSTAYLAVLAIAARMKKDNISCTAIPTSWEVKMTCIKHGIPTATLLDHQPMWYFDGADEVDENNNLIKGRGGAMFQEKLLMSASPENYILIDQSKHVKKLGEKFAIPVEIYPAAMTYVERELKKLGAYDITLRMAKGKDGPIITENGHFILDVRFDTIGNDLEQKIKAITGVIESGLFIGYNVTIIAAD